MTDVHAYKCLSCGAGLEFEPTSQKWACHFCSSVFTKEELDAAAEAPTEEEGEGADLDSYQCSTCGSELLTDGTTSATFCLFCGNPTIIRSRFTGKFHPKNLIPFKLGKKQAEEIYRKWIRSRIFAPKQFKNQREIEKITGIYAPFWMFDCAARGYLEGEGTHVHSYTRGDYRYTTTKFYRVVREGTVRYDNIPIDSSTKLDNTLMSMVEPYDYKDMVPFSMQYLSGFMSEKYDVESTEAETVMRQRAETYVEQRLAGTASGYSSLTFHQKDIQLSDTTQEYVLMPIYLLINHYKGKEHAFFINGQTGKIVGQTPVSAGRQILFALSVFVGVWLLAVLGGALYV